MHEVKRRASGNRLADIHDDFTLNSSKFHNLFKFLYPKLANIQQNKCELRNTPILCVDKS